jgi:hypothetical protein
VAGFNFGYVEQSRESVMRFGPGAGFSKRWRSDAISPPALHPPHPEELEITLTRNIISMTHSWVSDVFRLYGIRNSGVREVDNGDSVLKLKKCRHRT